MCPHRLRCLNTCSQTGDAILRGCRNFRRWGQVVGSESWVLGIWRLCLAPGSVPYTPSYLPWRSSSTNAAATGIFCPGSWGQGTVDWNIWNPDLKINIAVLSVLYVDSSQLPKVTNISAKSQPGIKRGCCTEEHSTKGVVWTKSLYQKKVWNSQKNGKAVGVQMRRLSLKSWVETSISKCFVTCCRFGQAQHVLK